MSQGKLIVIEGGDSSGKATQTELLTVALKNQGHLVEQLAFPRYQDNSIGSLIRECLDGKHGDFMSTDARIASLLYATDRRESLPQIQSWLNEGKIVILDRYTSANLLHQGAKIEYKEERKKVLDWIYNLEHKILDLPVPDILFYLDVPAATRFQLMKKQGRILDLAEESAKHQSAVDAAAEDMLKVYECSVSIDCMEGDRLLSPEAISERIFSHVNRLLEI